MFPEKYIAIMKKNMYIEPKTEVLSVNTEHLMVGITVSEGGDPPEGGAHMPGRKGEIIP